ncbi:DnaJ C-terminal domain-containing protein [Amnibacterium sp.]|uniref:DnaJ C-terminal domain-containing protein n=1 Tax=Amnibacterium sp. TaxID=1872496 RepID=UPI003F7C9F8F
MAEDFYETLGVSRTADVKQIRRAYRALARKYHPDVNKDPGADERFKRISEAHHVLSDPELRAQYDRFGPDFRQYAAAGQAAGGGGEAPPRGRRPSGSPRYTTWSSASTDGADAGIDWDDLFGEVFGRSARGADHSAELALSVEEAFKGGRRTVRLQDAGGAVHDLDIEIPAGVVDGQRVRVSGAGGEARGDAGAGDLVVSIRVRSDRRYRLDGVDIEMDLPVSPWEAALGAEVRVRAPGGRVTVHVPPGSPSGRRLRLRGQGMPRPGGQNGDLLARVKILVPDPLTAHERELFEELRRASSFDPRKST